MKNIIVLTKSLISEQELEQQLQQLDCEVYVSKRVLEQCLYDEVNLNLLRSFEIILVSETISNNELSWLLPAIKEANAFIIRKTDSDLSGEEKRDWKKQGVFSWIKTHNTLEELRESIDEVVNRKNAKSLTSNIVALRRSNEQKRFSTLTLTHKERRLMTLLFQANGSTVSREELSYKLWGKAPCNSTLTQLSTLTNKMKIKLAEQGIYGDIIQTVWGVGYKLMDDFYDQVISDEVVVEM
ncbi:winged helix-turn-helix domain-containing protein [Candidatus Enterococcus murrayae]|uniref:Winged helix-turn-helix domain-containing protein n=1 Tax=Candidatus Enterococcus murrayae TaxID=2815321 RepID=A0ABS3HCJ8_9ENTE|nr:helix-turn-helix domain-containing protein [Enterococcus sp. MJM16]MBO0451177.1 winged helix-turn-helix domain-containing protein [Enterococcus sp. MJM16]